MATNGDIVVLEGSGYLWDVQLNGGAKTVQLLDAGAASPSPWRRTVTSSSWRAPATSGTSSSTGAEDGAIARRRQAVSFAVAPDGDIVVLEGSGYLWDIQLNGGAGTVQLLDAGAAVSFAVAPNGDIVVLEGSGYLWDVQLNGGAKTVQLLDAGAAVSFAVAPTVTSSSWRAPATSGTSSSTGGAKTVQLLDAARRCFSPSPGTAM